MSKKTDQAKAEADAKAKAEAEAKANTSAELPAKNYVTVIAVGVGKKTVQPGKALSAEVVASLSDAKIAALIENGSIVESQEEITPGAAL